MVSGVLLGILAAVFSVIGFALTVGVALIAAAWTVTRFIGCRATPAAARGAYRTTSLVGRGACRGTVAAGRGVRYVAHSADSFWKRRGGHAARTPMPARPSRVRLAEAKRPSVLAPILSVLALTGGSVWAVGELFQGADRAAYATPALDAFAKHTTLVYGEGEPYRFSTAVFDAVVRSEDVPVVGRTGFHSDTLDTGADLAAGVSGIGISHTVSEFQGDDSVWAPLLWPGESFEIESDLPEVAALPDDAVLYSGRLQQVARASARFATPQEAFEDLLLDVAYDSELVTTPVPESDRAATAVKALQMSAERLALVKRPLVVEGKPLGEVYRLHIALDADQFGTEWASVAAGIGRSEGDPRRLAILAAIVAAGTIGLGVVARGKPA